MTDVKKIVINLIQAFCITFAIFNIGRFESGNILLLILFVFSYLLLQKSDVKLSIAVKDGDTSDNTSRQSGRKNQIIRERNISVILGIIFTLLYMAGGYDVLTGGLENKLFVLIYVMLTAAGLFCIFYYIVRMLLGFLSTSAARNITGINVKTSENNAVTYAQDSGVVNSIRGFDYKIYLTYFLIILVCMIPLFLMNYPAVMTPDSIIQYLQAVHAESFSNHHPWFHTLTIGLFYNIGYGLTGSVYGGLATYTVFQMLIIAASVAYAIECVYEMGVSGKVRVAMLLAFVLYPYNLIYAVTMWKDVLFAIATLLFTVEIYRVVVCEKEEIRDYIIFVISGVLMSEYRHNGFYGYIITAVIVLIYLIINRAAYSGRDVVKTGSLLFIVFAIVLVINGPVTRAYNVEEPPAYLSLSIPLQQMARVVADDGNLSDEEYAYIASINDIDYIKENYEPGCSDNISQWVGYGNSEIISNNMLGFIAKWASIGIKNPGKYLAAYIDQTKGYYYPMNPEQTVFYGICDNSVGLDSEPVLTGPVVVKTEELLYKLHTMLPVYAVLYSAGSALWLFLFFGALVINKGKIRELLAFLPVAALTLTILIATPLVADIRYAYELIVTLPFLAVIALKGYNKKDC